jgi:EmrB/QacA subfamily drug resistance transporter
MATLASPARAYTDEQDSRYRWEVLVVVMVGTLMAALDSSIVNISLPDIMADFGATLDSIEWVVTGYMLAYAVFIPLASWARERLGSRKLYIYSLVLFTVGSLLCGLAWDLPSLIVARVLQAFGGGFITPTGMAMVSEVFPPKERGRAMGLWGLGVIVGPALGPTIGGYLTKTVGWRSIFMVNIPIGVLTILLAQALLRPSAAVERSHRKPFDAWGFLFLAIFLVGFLLGVSKGEREGWTSAYILSCFGSSLLGLMGFIAAEVGTKYGILDFSLFESKVFTASILVTAGRTVAIFGATFLLPLFMQNLMGLDELQSGLLLLPGSLLLALCMPLAGRLSDKMGPRYLVLGGSLGMAFFMYLDRRLDANSSELAVVLPTFVRGVSAAFMVAPVMATALNSIPTDKATAGSVLLNVTQQVAGSAGIAVLATVLDHRQHYQMAALSQGLQANGGLSLGGSVRQAVELGYSHRDAAVAAMARAGALVGKASAVRAFDDTFLVGGAIILAATLPVFLLPTHNVAHGPQEGAVAME